LTGANINLRALVSPPAGLNAATAAVRYVLKKDGVTAFATGPVSRGTTGDWLATISGGLPPGLYAVHTYIVGTSYDGEGPVATLAVKFNICRLYDQTKAVKRGSTVPIKLQLCTATGANLSAAAITLHGVSLQQVSGSVTGVLEDPGSANPDLDFRYDATFGGYIYNLSTKNLAIGAWRLTFTALDRAGGTSTQTYMTDFQVK